MCWVAARTQPTIELLRVDDIKSASVNMIPSPFDVGAEAFVINSVLWLKLVVESVGALVIGIGMVASFVAFA